MSKARIKVTVKKGTPNGKRLVASMPIAITRNSNPTGQRLYQTKAQLHMHLYRGQRPQTPRLRRAN